MKLAQYEVEVSCVTKKEGRQLAAQKILQVKHFIINEPMNLKVVVAHVLANASTNKDLGLDTTTLWIKDERYVVE